MVKNVDDALFEEEHFHADHSDSELNAPSALLPPVQRHTTAGIHPLSKSVSNSRMAFIRRPKRTEAPSSRRLRDTDSKSGDEMNGNVTEDGGMSDHGLGASSGHIEMSTPVPPVCPEGSLKKRVIRIEKTIAEQTAWVQNKFELEESDSLLDSCSAALVKKIMLQGRLHITSTAICFYAKIFGSVTKEKWPFSTIHSVRKRRGGFVANSIKITFVNSQTPPVVIASLNRREQTLAIIASRLSVLSPAAIEPASRAGSVDGESEDHSDGFGHFDTSTRGDRNRSDRSNCSTPLLSVSDAPSRNSLDGNIARHGSDTTSEDAVEMNHNHETIRDRTQLDALVWLKKGDPVDKVKGKEFERRIEQVRGTLNVPVILAFNSLFVTDWMITNFHPANTNTDVQSSKWYLDEAEGTMRRDVKYRRPLGFRIGPKETRCEETQRYCFMSDGSVLVELENNSLDAPFGDYFCVESYFELKPVNKGCATELITSIAVHFSKSTMLRSKIEAGALSETKTSYTKLIQMCKEHLNSTIPRAQVEAVLRKYGGRKIPQRTEKRADTQRANQANVALPEPRKEPRLSPATSARASMDLAPKSSGVAQTPHPSAPMIQMDPNSSQLLRVIAVASLLLVCILLIFVLLSFRRMEAAMDLVVSRITSMQCGATPK